MLIRVVLQKDGLLSDSPHIAVRPATLSEAMLIGVVLQKDGLLSPYIAVGPTASAAGENQNCAKLD